MGMDGHTDSIAVASVAQDHGAEVTSLGTFGTRQGDIAHRIRKMPSTAQQLSFGYEAGPCGSWLYRYLSTQGDDGWGVAPSLLPQTPGDRVNTDRRDAVPWASLARSGDLTAVDVPTGAAEAMRDLTRARDDASRARHDAQLRLNAVWLRHASRYTGPAHGGAAHRRWLSAGVGPTPAPPSVLQAYVRAVNDHSARLPRLAQARQAHVNAWRVSPVVEALPAWRGVPLTVAVTLVAAMGDLTRVEPPRELRQCMGLMPSASSSGEPRRQGAMTQAGHTPARRVRVDGAWAYRDPAQLRRHWPRRLEHHPTVIQDMRWKAHVRRCPRDRRLVARGKHAHVVTVAMARELTGFMGAMATEVSGIASDQDGS
jgi:transposase